MYQAFALGTLIVQSVSIIITDISANGIIVNNIVNILFNVNFLFINVRPYIFNREIWIT